MVSRRLSVAGCVAWYRGARESDASDATRMMRAAMRTRSGRIADRLFVHTVHVQRRDSRRIGRRECISRVRAREDGRRCAVQRRALEARDDAAARRRGGGCGDAATDVTADAAYKHSKRVFCGVLVRLYSCVVTVEAIGLGRAREWDARRERCCGDGTVGAAMQMG
jgi:hypothetical protein